MKTISSSNPGVTAPEFDQEETTSSVEDRNSNVPRHEEETTTTRRSTGAPPHHPSARRPGRETSMNSASGGVIEKTKTRKKKRPASRRRSSLVARNPEELESELREAYFSAAGWVALRYETGVEEVIDHLRRNGLHRALRPQSAIQYMEDAVLATAALKGNARAWHDLEQVFSQPLTRTCTLHLSDQEAIIHVRRFITELKRATLARKDRRDRGLLDYDGLRPLRVWLVDRLLAQLEAEGPEVRIRLQDERTTARLRLAD